MLSLWGSAQREEPCLWLKLLRQNIVHREVLCNLLLGVEKENVLSLLSKYVGNISFGANGVKFLLLAFNDENKKNFAKSYTWWRTQIVQKVCFTWAQCF